MMIAFLNRFGITPRLLFSALIPLAAMLFFAALLIADHRQNVIEMERIENLAALAPKIGNVIHELQKERGISAGYIRSQGAEDFRARLTGQHQETDRVVTAFNRALEDFDFSAFRSEIPARLSAVGTAIANLGNERNGVLQLTRSGTEMSGYYTETITKLIGIINRIGDISTNASISKELMALVALIEAKETMGQERALGVNGFSDAEFDANELREFVGLIAAGQSFISVFKGYASDGALTLFEQGYTGSAIQEVDRLRDIGARSPFTHSLEGITAAYWFDEITKRIDLMNGIENKLSEILLATTLEIKEAAESSFTLFIIQAVIITLAVIAIVILVSRSLSQPLGGLSNAMGNLSRGDLGSEIPGTAFGSQIGDMARALEVFKESAIENKRLEAEAKKQEEAREATERAHQEKEALRVEEEKKQEIVRQEEARKQRNEMLGSMVAEVNEKTSELVGRVIDQTKTLLDMAEKLAHNTTSMGQNSQAVASAAEETTANAQTVASASEELSASIGEIVRQVNHSTDIARDATEKAQGMANVIENLSGASNQIGEVVGLIQDIAEQTNLLALNATIEAARAGEAGKGFAVVASEVKNLASQTAKATDDIARQINEMQENTAASVSAIEVITEIINKISSSTTEIMTAVTEQGSATTEISSNVQETTQASKEVSARITDIAQSANETGALSGELKSLADSLSDDIENLSSSISEVIEGTAQKLAS